MECYVKIVSEEQELTPVTLVQKALSSTTLSLTLLGNNSQEITIIFKHAKLVFCFTFHVFMFKCHNSTYLFFRDVFIPDIQNSPSTSSMVSHCHFDGLYGVSHSALSLCHPEHIAGIISTNSNIFILEARNATYFMLLPQSVKNCVTLVWVDIWRDGDKFEVATIGDKTLDLFLDYRKKFIKDHPNDNAHMLT
uniref:Peptidase M12B domain-containing protein n=1 Tax=Heterorhabditis bacteriophora TaxID=37862 RepID=A0A1I7WGN7_HETBA